MKKIYLVSGFLLFALIGVIAGLISVILTTSTTPVSTTPVVQGFMPVTGAYVSVLRTTGEIEDLCENQGGWCHNVFTDAGKNATRDILAYQIYYGNFTYIGLCNATAGCTAGATDTTIDNEYTTNGLSRVAGTVNTFSSSPGNWSVYKEFTATANSLSTNMTGLLNQSSGGTLLAVVTFTDVTLQNGDKLTINYTATAT